MLIYPEPGRGDLSNAASTDINSVDVFMTLSHDVNRRLCHSYCWEEHKLLITEGTVYVIYSTGKRSTSLACPGFG